MRISFERVFSVFILEIQRKLYIRLIYTFCVIPAFCNIKSCVDSVNILCRSEDNSSVSSDSTTDSGHIVCDHQTALTALIISIICNRERTCVDLIVLYHRVRIFVYPEICLYISIADNIDTAAFSRTCRTQFDVLSLGICCISIDYYFRIFCISKSSVSAECTEPKSAAVSGVTGIIMVISLECARICLLRIADAAHI